MNISMQKFLNYDNVSICYSGKQNTKLKYNTNCILRMGIGMNKNQSFLECLANVYNSINNDEDFIKLSKKTKTVKDIKKILNNITIEQFYSTNKGNLVSRFYDKDVKIENKNINIKKLDKNDLNKVRKAKTNFLNFVNSDSTYIDHQYLWDLICSSKKDGGLFFENGVNLMIFNNPSNDVVEKVELICPITEYSENIFDSAKPTIMLYCENKLYEPLVIVKNQIIKSKSNEKTYMVKKYFEQTDLDENVKELKDSFIIIKNTLMNECKPIFNELIETNWGFVENIYLKQLLNVLDEVNTDKSFKKKNYILETQLVNKHFQVVGIMLKNGLFVPCKPSSVILDKPYEFLLESLNTLTYKKTLDKLRELYDKVGDKTKFPLMQKNTGIEK